MIESTEESLHDSTSWTKAVDRGGLIHVNDCVFDVFAEMEIVLWKNLKACKQDKLALQVSTLNFQRMSSGKLSAETQTRRLPYALGSAHRGIMTVKWPFCTQNNSSLKNNNANYFKLFKYGNLLHVVLHSDLCKSCIAWFSPTSNSTEKCQINAIYSLKLLCKMHNVIIKHSVKYTRPRRTVLLP